MSDAGQDLVSFLGVPADERLLDADLDKLPDAEQRREPVISTASHDRLVAAGSFATAATLIGGVALALVGLWQVIFEGGGALYLVLALLGILLAATHWGWVHVAEYAGLTIDARRQRAVDQARRDWLAQLQPYPRVSVRTSVLGDASTRVQRFRHRPVLTERGTFTFTRDGEAETDFAADAPAEVIAAGVETMRRQARLENDRVEGLWQAARTSYDAAMLNAHGEREQLAAQHAAAAALSEHINASLLEPPLVE